MQSHTEHEDNIVWYLTDGYWQDGGGLRRKFDVDPGGYLMVNVVNLSEADQKAAWKALDTWEKITGIEFRDIEEVDVDPDDADIVFLTSSGGNPHANVTAHQGIINQSRVYIPADLTPPNLHMEDYRLRVYVHEIGHALGLGHPGNYNDDPDEVTANDAKYPADDTWLFTAMSYFGKIPGIQELDSGVPVTPMLYDVIAIWALYGKPTAGVNAGDSRHIWTMLPGIPKADDLRATATLADTGGHDVLVLGHTHDVILLESGIGNSGLLQAGEVVGHGSINGRSALPIDPVIWYGKFLGSESTTHGPAEDISLVIYGTIEDVEGGGGNDWLAGNAEDNKLYGDAGDDVLEGGAGSDVLTGGDGVDTALYTRSPSGVTVRLHSRTLQAGHAEGDTWGTLLEVEYEKNGLVLMETVPDIEALGGSRHDDILAGDSRANILWGGAGNDRLYGGPGGGDDEIYGGSGDDALYGGLGNDRLRGGPGEDVLIGGRDADTFVFAPGDSEGENGHTLNYVRDFNPKEGDRIDLSAWATKSSVTDIRQSVETTGLHLDLDQDGSWDIILEGYLDRILDTHTIFEPPRIILNGTSVDDILKGGPGNDELDGNSGNDELYGEAGNDELHGSSGDDFLFGGPGRDLLHGGLGRDTLYGNDDNDILVGGLGDDTLVGGEGNDSLEGGDGKDELFGEAGDDELRGGDGFEWLYGGEGNDRLYSGVGFDVGIDGSEWGSELHGGPGDDYLEGSPHRDALFGGLGDDILDGGLNPDSLKGGTGADTFVFAPGDSGGYFEYDTISDFNPTEGDRIDLTAYDEIEDVQDIRQSAFQNGPTTGWVIDLDQDGYWEIVLDGYFEHVLDEHFIFARQTEDIF